MENHEFMFSVLWLFGLLGLATIIKSVSGRFKFPFAVGLLLAGLGLTLLMTGFDLDLARMEFSPELVFYVFLPTLIFESAYHLNFRHFRRVLPEATILASVGIAIAMAVTASILHFALELPWGASWLFGAFISATDPVAVLAIFKELKAPHRLATIVDGESLINDGTALVVFQLLFKSVVLGGAVTLGAKSFFMQSLDAVQTIGLGIIVGIVLGWMFSLTIPRMKSRGAQLTLSIILAHVTFLVAEGLLGVSGILATMSAGIIMGNFGRRKLSTQAQRSFSEIWKFLEFVSNSLIFLLLGMKMGTSDFFVHWRFVLVAILATVFIARPASVFPSFALSNLFRKKRDRVPFSYQVITSWGGIRGALAAAAVLLLPTHFPYVAEFQAMTAGVVLTTFLLKATTIPYWLQRFGLIKLNHTERIQRIEAQVLINERITEHLKEMKERKYISAEIYDKLLHHYRSKQDRAEHELDVLQSAMSSNAREIEKTLILFALGIEMKTYRRLFERGELSERRLRILQGSILRQFDRIEKDVLPTEYISKVSYAPSIPHMKACPFEAEWLKNLWKKYRTHRISERWQHYRARRIASWRVILDFRDLKGTHPIFKKSEIVEELLKRYKGWNGNSEKKMRHIENQYPEVINPLRLMVAEASCLKHETELEEEFLGKGLISEKVFENLDEDVRRRQEKCHVRDDMPNLFA